MRSAGCPKLLGVVEGPLACSWFDHRVPVPLVEPLGVDVTFVHIDLQCVDPDRESVMPEKVEDGAASSHATAIRTDVQLVEKADTPRIPDVRPDAYERNSERRAACKDREHGVARLLRRHSRRPSEVIRPGPFQEDTSSSASVRVGLVVDDPHRCRSPRCRTVTAPLCVSRWWFRLPHRPDSLDGWGAEQRNELAALVGAPLDPGASAEPFTCVLCERLGRSDRKGPHGVRRSRG